MTAFSFRIVHPLLLMLALLAPVATAEAFEAEVKRYLEAVLRVCQTGVTPELVQVYEQALKAADDAKYGGGRASNFWGPKDPERSYLDCVQAPGWE